MKLKELEMILQECNGFEEPKVAYEQYQTSHHVASRIMHCIESTFEDIHNHIVADVGCGCGILSIASSLLGANFVTGFDIDSDALLIAQQNIQQFDDLTNIDLIQADVKDDDVFHRFNKAFDVVVMNPPFGTKRNKGIDVTFLKRAKQLANKSVYSLHKSSTRQHILQKAADWNLNGQVIAQLRFDLPASYGFHKHSNVDIEVDLFRFTFK